MDSILKLNLKKDIFEQVVNGHTSYLTFETTPFYFSRFTTSKNNSIEDVKNDPTLFKTFDKVQFACSGETIECDVKKLNFTTSLEPNHETSFYLKFDSHVKPEEKSETETEENAVETEVPNDETSKPEEVVDESNVEVSENNIPEIEVETEKTSLLNDTVKIDEVVEVDDTNPTIDFIINEFVHKHNVYCVNTSNVKVGYKGKVWGCYKDKSLPINNEHDHCVTLEKIIINDYTNLSSEIDKLTKSGYLFVDVEHINIDKRIITLYVKNVSKLEMLNWI